MIKAVLFDMDGTLLNTLTDLTRSVNFALKSLGCPERSEAEVAQFVGNGIANAIRLALPDGSDAETASRALELFTEYYEKNSRVDTGAYPGVVRLLRSLERLGYGTAIVSNKFDGAVRELSDVFFGVAVAIGESEAMRRKPAPDMVYEALRRLGCRPDEAVYVGDTEVDYLTATNSGCTPLLVSWGFRSRVQLEKLGAPIAASAEEALEIIRSLG
jgi:phosphoglycolate phosphatase